MNRSRVINFLHTEKCIKVNGNSEFEISMIIVTVQSKIKFFLLTLKAPITTAADDIHIYFFHCFSGKIRRDVSSESSARFT